MSRLIERIAFLPPYFDHMDPILCNHRKRLGIQLLQLPCEYPHRRSKTASSSAAPVMCTSLFDPTECFEKKESKVDTISFLSLTYASDTMPSGRPRPTILFAHGNAEDIPSGYEYYNYFRKMTSCNIVVFDYLGYGFSSGDRSEKKKDCTEANAYRAIQAMFNHIIGPMRIPRESVIVLGRSLGSGCAVELAKRESAAGLGGLIVYSGLYSAAAVVRGGRWLPSPLDCFVNCNKVGSITNVPILVMHGDKDEIVPFWHGVGLAELAKKRNSRVDFVRMEGCGHNDLEVKEPIMFFKALNTFVEVCSGGSTRSHTGATRSHTDGKYSVTSTSISVSRKSSVVFSRIKPMDDSELKMWRD